MAQDISELKKKLEQLKQTLEERLPDIAETVAITAKALSNRTIVEQGFGPKYSQNRIPAWFLKGKELNAGGRKYLESHGIVDEGKKTKRKKKGEAAKVDKTVTWKEFREAQGLPTEHVNLTYSGQMWPNMQVVRVENVEGKVTAYLGGTNREAVDEMNYNFVRFGDFVRKGLTEESGSILGNLVIEEIEKVFNQIDL